FAFEREPGVPFDQDQTTGPLDHPLSAQIALDASARELPQAVVDLLAPRAHDPGLRIDERTFPVAQMELADRLADRNETQHQAAGLSATPSPRPAAHKSGTAKIDCRGEFAAAKIVRPQQIEPAIPASDCDLSLVVHGGIGDGIAKLQRADLAALDI